MNNDSIAGKFEEAVGKVKQSVGEAIGNDRLANSGAADQVKGNAKETWGNVKDAAADTTDSARSSADTRTSDARLRTEETGNDLRDRVTNAAHNAKENISDKTEAFKERHS